MKGEIAETASYLGVIELKKQKKKDRLFGFVFGFFS
jgi:hypothetical protein